jgi:hypothetical protein
MSLSLLTREGACVSSWPFPTTSGPMPFGTKSSNSKSAWRQATALRERSKRSRGDVRVLVRARVRVRDDALNSQGDWIQPREPNLQSVFSRSPSGLPVSRPRPENRRRIAAPRRDSPPVRCRDFGLIEEPLPKCLRWFPTEFVGNFPGHWHSQTKSANIALKEVVP